MSNIPMLIGAVLCFSLIVFAHELGHFLVAIWRGVPVREFSMGMGPLLFSRDVKDITYSLRLLPIGAYVSLVGEESGSDEERSSYYSSPVADRIALTFAGPFFNFVVSVLIFSLLGVFVGIATNDPFVGEVLPGSIAEAGGLQSGDRFMFIDNVAIESWTDVVQTINAAPDREIAIVVQRGTGEQTLYVVPERSASDGLGRIGISSPVDRFNILESVKLGFINTGTAIQLFFTTFAEAIAKRQMPDLVGPVGIIQTTGQIAQHGFADLLMFMAYISINLGVVNLLPIPPLDGARIVLMFIEAIRGKPLPPEREGMVHLVGYIFLFGMMALVTVWDVMRIMGG